ncbi:MarR family winged helix-turn-helix transcriptional regulator [Desmospora activa]|uniref:DNA-binding MarR family transcriptional regulator n=1 Tax=Desmospora activa DSM 45169 TaxID=1121389 RepID=A0A2T4Z8C3_9BACL|nr:MarR family transcriptional regulator [Desmospora activa]PTM58128.1 DNA-binding MarR family transcriptional regulator [Desmospora activa DSM 45169]
MSERQQLIDELEQAFRQVFRQWKKEIHDVMGKGVNRGQFVILRHLYTHGPQRASALSTEFDVSNSHITQLSDQLVKKEWIERRRSQEDKRVVEMMITATGIEAVEAIEKKRLEYFRHKFDSFTTEEINALLHLIRKADGDPQTERGKTRGTS